MRCSIKGLYLWIIAWHSELQTLSPEDGKVDDSYPEVVGIGNGSAVALCAEETEKIDKNTVRHLNEMTQVDMSAIWISV